MDDAPAPIAADSADPRPFQPARGGGASRAAVALAAALTVLALGAGGYLAWQQYGAASVAEPAKAEPPVAVAPATESAPSAPEPAIRHPIDTTNRAEAPAGPSSLEQADGALRRALIDWLGAKPVATMLQTDGFVRGVVATVDNLGRAHAAPRLWPVTPPAGRFTVQRVGDTEVVAPANAARYEGFVAFVESVDTARAVGLYKAFYPQFQAAYEELGYPRGYFNDRLVAVIDQLLATPEPAAPIALRLTEVKGEIASERPWVRYEFADPALQALPAGSKILLRMSPAQADRLKAKLMALRGMIAKP